MSRWCRIAGMVYLVALGCTREAGACSCTMSGPPCQEAWNADAVFAGTVNSIEPTAGLPGAEPGYRFVAIRIDVEEPFLNIAARPVELVSLVSGTCHYQFRAGETYLVYAWKTNDGRLSTSICSRTRPLSEAEEDLRYLRSIPPAGGGARVYGRVNEWQRDPAEERGVDYGPVENIIVNVRGAAFSQDVTTDRHGRYELKGIPAGKVTVSVVTAIGFRTHTAEGIEVRTPRGCVEANFTIAAEAGASGTVVDAAGRPVAGLMIDAVAAELAGYQPPPYQQPVKTDAYGVFEFERLPPGTYVVGVNLTKTDRTPASGPQIFYPGTNAVDRATAVELKPGDRKDLGVLKLPAH